MLHICMHNNYFLHSQRTYQLLDGLGSPLQNEEKRCPKKTRTEKKKGKILKMTALMHLNLLKTIPSLLECLTKENHDWIDIG